MLRGDDPQPPLRLAEGLWSDIRDALLNPDDWDDQDWLSVVSELGFVYSLVAQVRPTTPEERERLFRLVEDIRAVVSRYGLEPPELPEDI
ncbi:hypothetical protein Theos_1315 [Thermus oshimai JL-2]|uniref:Uncharacterized protein n=1 Tax=Thermus oshimai JL-2 TaxID=751945 RepID=K7QV90_THEOS|nr:hypothetical protein Theos_1315 [Thermus oshimai JL-2]